MALGGGTFTAQNKVLPGAYINFVSLAAASATLSDRGIAAIGLELDWGASGIQEITNADFQKNSLKLFGYAYDSDKLKGLRELFANIKTLYAYRLNDGGVKASCTYATAKYAGTRMFVLKKKLLEQSIYQKKERERERETSVMDDADWSRNTEMDQKMF